MKVKSNLNKYLSDLIDINVIEGIGHYKDKMIMTSRDTSDEYNIYILISLDDVLQEYNLILRFKL